eukprot:834133-Amphidinium_carterae.3
MFPKEIRREAIRMLKETSWACFIMSMMHVQHLESQQYHVNMVPALMELIEFVALGVGLKVISRTCGLSATRFCYCSKQEQTY